ncbi:SKP1-like protein 1B [Zingiber officinale]|uniref:SKP1 component POZ domain-containing protein n=1 Tax=Zingiber officinale TaxID=94328 RepID=A0A8J5M4V3_ZINOF|nr:SKP1-like protein 1B [Zingiber officinale]KAG6532288.1 hypothetical protein ZIOFF_006128 [Zingiber officinale]
MARIIMLRRSNDKVFKVEEAVAMELQTIKHMIEDDCTNNDIPLPNVSSKILTKVVEYYKKHIHATTSKSFSKDTAGSEISDEDLKSWDSKFIKVDPTNLFD